MHRSYNSENETFVSGEHHCPSIIVAIGGVRQKTGQRRDAGDCSYSRHRCSFPGMNRSPQDVADSHLAAVITQDVVAMAADYADDAVLERLGQTYRGHAAIADYFATVPERLGTARVVFDAVDVDGDVVTFSWHIEGATQPASGTDVCQVVDGAIVHQVVQLDASDF